MSNFYFYMPHMEKIILRGQIFKPAKAAEMHLLDTESFIPLILKLGFLCVEVKSLVDNLASFPLLCKYMLEIWELDLIWCC